MFKTNTDTLLVSVQNAFFSTYREVTRDKVEYIVVNGVPLVEGVLNGRFVPSAEFGDFVQDWNDVPVVIHHPQNNYGSAKVPNVDVPVVGRFYNAKLDGTRLVGEFWIEKDKLLASDTGKAIFDRIQNNKPIEVSTGYHAASLPESGRFNQKPYTLIDKDIHPDHIAILPDAVGACSIGDGCGLNRNEAVKINVMYKWSGEQVTLVHLSAGESIDSKLERIRGSFHDQMRKSDSPTLGDANKVEAMDVWIKEVFDDYIIADMAGQLYQVNYMDNGTYVTFEPKEMWQMVVIAYEPVRQNVKGAPEGLSKMWDSVYQSALKTYKGDKEKAAAAAWAAVKKKYKKVGDKWVLKKKSTNNSQLTPEEALGFVQMMVFANSD